MADTESLLVPPLRQDATLDAAERLTRRLLDAQHVSTVVVMDIDHLPDSAIQHVAERFSLTDEPAWELAESDAARRQLLKRAFELHRYKGTPYAVRLVFELLGLGEAFIEEGRAGLTFDGGRPYDGFSQYGSDQHWAVYRVFFQRLLTAAQAATARRMLALIAPARCALYEINFAGASLIYNGFASYDGAYSFGAYK